MKFYPGLHHPCDGKHFERCMISVNALRDRKSDFEANEWMLDSGAFTDISRHGGFRTSVKEYAAQVLRWSRCGQMVVAVAQDYMCEPFILAKTGMTVADHQRLTIQRYDALEAIVGLKVYVLPVLQGYWPDEYLCHLRQYNDRLFAGAWVGVGSVCKRNARIEEIEQVLVTIKRERPDLKLHGFGVKLTALQSSLVRESLYSADSMAWSLAARYEGRPSNSWREAKRFARRIEIQDIRRREFQGRFIHG